MDKYRIVTDATCDLTQQLADEFEIDVIPMRFTLGNKEYSHYLDMRELNLKDFYEGLKKGLSATTTQITPNNYYEHFEPMLKEGYDIIYMALSSGLSSTYSASCVAAEELMEMYPGRRITCIDSRCASIGEGLLSIYAGSMHKKGLGYDEMVEYIQKTKKRVNHWFMVEDLEQLKRGGRISSLEAVLGAALKIHPILTVNGEGRLTVSAKARGEKKALSCIRERFAEDKDEVTEFVIIGHSAAQERAEELRQKLVDEGLIKEAFICDIGPVIGSHVGNGMCALVFLGNNHNEYGEDV